MTRASSSSNQAGRSLKRSSTDACNQTSGFSVPVSCATCKSTLKNSSWSTSNDWHDTAIWQELGTDLQSCDAQLPLHAAGGDHQLHRAQGRLPLELARRLQLAVFVRERIQRC